MWGAVRPVPRGQTGLVAGEGVGDLSVARPGRVFLPFPQAFRAVAKTERAQEAPNSIAEQKFYGAGVWRDYARQSGAIAMAYACGA